MVRGSTALATLPLIGILSIAYIAILVGNAVLLADNLKVEESAVSDVDHGVSDAQVSVATTFELDDPTVEPPVLYTAPPADLDLAQAEGMQYFEIIGSVQAHPAPSGRLKQREP